LKADIYLPSLEDQGSIVHVLRNDECTKTKERPYMVSDIDGSEPQNAIELKR
jgi:hypothetical protein